MIIAWSLPMFAVGVLMVYFGIETAVWAVLGIVFLRVLSWVW